MVWFLFCTLAVLLATALGGGHDDRGTSASHVEIELNVTRPRHAHPEVAKNPRHSRLRKRPHSVSGQFVQLALAHERVDLRSLSRVETAFVKAVELARQPKVVGTIGTVIGVQFLVFAGHFRMNTRFLVGVAASYIAFQRWLYFYEPTAFSKRMMFHEILGLLGNSQAPGFIAGIVGGASAISSPEFAILALHVLILQLCAAMGVMCRWRIDTTMGTVSMLSVGVVSSFWSFRSKRWHLAVCTAGGASAGAYALSASLAYGFLENSIGFSAIQAIIHIFEVKWPLQVAEAGALSNFGFSLDMSVQTLFLSAVIVLTCLCVVVHLFIRRENHDYARAESLMECVFHMFFQSFAVAMTCLWSYRIDWDNTCFPVGLFYVVLNSFTIALCASASMGQLWHAVIRIIWGFPALHHSDICDQGIPDDQRTLIAYCLRGYLEESCVEAFNNAMRSYLLNVDPNCNVACGVVTATSRLSLIQREAQLLVETRNSILKTLKAEADEVVRRAFASPDDTEAPMSEGSRLRADFWAELVAKGGENEKRVEMLERLHAKAHTMAANFFWLHRTSTVLKKTGQYQDLMALTTLGYSTAYAYVDVKYGKLGRHPGEETFGLHGNVEEDGGLPDGPSIGDMAKAMSEDVLRLQQCGKDPSRRFVNTMIMDSDGVFEQPGSIRRLVEVASSYKEYAIFQPKIMSTLRGRTFFSLWLDNIAAPCLNESVQRTFNRTMFVGQAMVVNEAYLDALIGRPMSMPIEALPVTTMSHDSIEAIILRACYVPDVIVYSDLPNNVITWASQQFRWQLGEILNMSTYILKPVYLRMPKLNMTPGSTYIWRYLVLGSHLLAPFVTIASGYAYLFSVRVSNNLPEKMELLVSLPVLAVFVVPTICIILEVVPSLGPEVVNVESRFALCGKRLLWQLSTTFGWIVFYPGICAHLFYNSCGVIKALVTGHVSWAPQSLVERNTAELFRSQGPLRTILRHTFIIPLAGVVILFLDFNTPAKLMCIGRPWVAVLLMLYPFFAWALSVSVEEESFQRWPLRWYGDMRRLAIKDVSRPPIRRGCRASLTACEAKFADCK